MKWEQAEVTLRPETSDDVTFLEELVFSVREGEIGFRELLLGERTRILKEQARLQSADYHKRFPGAHFVIIQLAGKPIGRFYVDHTEERLRVIELSIMPLYQRHGIGHHLMKSVLAEGMRIQVPVVLSVEIGNPAQGFYEKLGFTVQKTGASHHAMMWTPLMK